MEGHLTVPAGVDPRVVRPHFPAIRAGAPLFFDNPAGTQICAEALGRMQDYLVARNANHGGAFRASRESDAMVREARAAMADLLGASTPRRTARGLAAWIRTTWMPYTARVPEERRESFIAEAVDLYLSRYPLDAEGRAAVDMVRLEVEAAKR